MPQTLKFHVQLWLIATCITYYVYMGVSDRRPNAQICRAGRALVLCCVQRAIVQILIADTVPCSLLVEHCMWEQQLQ